MKPTNYTMAYLRVDGKMPIDDSPWGTLLWECSGDQYGIEWMIDFDPNSK